MSVMDPTAAEGEEQREVGLRPQVLGEFQGQAALKENLSVFIQAARGRSEALDHVFISGPPGLGKTTLAGIMANELGVELKVTSAPALDKPKDIAGLLTTLTDKSVFFIDEIHRLKPAIEEMLYIAMEDGELDWIIGQGPSARTVRIPLPKFTWWGPRPNRAGFRAPCSPGSASTSGSISTPKRNFWGFSCGRPTSLRWTSPRTAPGCWPSAAGEPPGWPTACCAGCGTLPRSRATG